MKIDDSENDYGKEKISIFKIVNYLQFMFLTHSYYFIISKYVRQQL